MRLSRSLLLLFALPLTLPAQGLSPEASAGAGASVLGADDWGAIAEAHRARRYAAVPEEGGLVARNEAQGWSIGFDGRGVLVRSDEGRWEWGLELLRFGFAGAERTVERPSAVAADGVRVRYEWPGRLEEWYVNEPAGLEHGFTLRERPEGGGAGPLVLTLGVRGPLAALGNADREGVRFADAAGRVVLRYTKLLVLDAEGRRLEARLEPVAEGLAVTVEEEDAEYPLTIDPIAQEAYLKAAFPGGDVGGIGVTGDLFGIAVAMSGDRVVIGAPYEDGGSTGVNGNQQDESGTNSGAAYVFVRSGGVWSQEAYLKASNAGSSGGPAVPGDQFGTSVGISGDTIVVGAPLEDSAATGVGGDEADDSAVDAGAAYVFVRSGGVWSQEAYLKASNAEEEDRFGLSVAVSGDTVIVGADREDGAATGVNGDDTSNGAFRAGAAYVFTRQGGSWSQEAYLKASNTEPNDDFGTAVALCGDTALVGAIGEDGSVPGVNGNESDNGLSHSGATYVFRREDGQWSQEAYLKASNPGLTDEFGSALAIDGDLVAVGAQQEDSHATVINGNQTSNRRTDAGAAYAFVRNGTTWTQEAYLKASNAAGWGGPTLPTGDHFGCALAVSGNRVLVGARWEESDATGVNGNQVSNAAGFSGAAFLFLRSGTSWNQIAYLKASNTEGGDEFGRALAMDGDLLVIGAPIEDGGAGGVNPDESAAPSASAAGAAYAFLIDTQPAVTFRNAGSNPASYVADPLVVGGTFTATVDNAAAGQLASAIIAFQTPFEFTLGAGQVLLCLDFQGIGELFTGAGLFPSSSAGGVDSYSFPFPNEPLYVGASFCTQAIQFGNPPFVLSNAQDLSIGQ